jgi:hypothetical protein
MPCWSTSGSPASLCTRTNSVEPARREASTRNAPSARRPAIEASRQVADTDGKILSTPPDPCTSMSTRDCAAVIGLSMAKFDPSRYIVFAVSSVSATTFRSRKNFK